MVCDSDRGDGGIYFYNEYLEWRNRDTGRGFRIQYKDIKDVKVVYTRKKTVTLITNSGYKENLYLYKYDEFIHILNGAMERVKGNQEAPALENKGDDLDRLERLAKLHESGALTDEEFTKAKQKILG